MFAGAPDWESGEAYAVRFAARRSHASQRPKTPDHRQTTGGYPSSPFSHGFTQAFPRRWAARDPASPSPRVLAERWAPHPARRWSRESPGIPPKDVTILLLRGWMSGILYWGYTGLCIGERNGISTVMLIDIQQCNDVVFSSWPTANWWFEVFDNLLCYSSLPKAERQSLSG